MKRQLRTWLASVFYKQAKRIIHKHKPIVVAVAGSVGKTSTKLAIVQVLKQKYRVQYQDGNYNANITVPLIVTGQTMPSLVNVFGWLTVWLAGQKYIHGAYPYDVVVLELGTDKPGEIIDFRRMVRPDIAVVTSISEEHMEFFENLEAVAEEELAIAQYAKQLVINADDVAAVYTKMFVPKNVPVSKFGFSKGCHYKIAAHRNSHHSFTATVTTPTDKTITTEAMVAAKHSLKSVAAAVAVADMLDLTPAQIRRGVSQITPPAGRMRLLEGKSKSLIIDDTYNSSPLAAAAALSTLYEMKASQKIAILGSMNELGSVSKEAHQSIGALCVPDKLDLLITIGNEANTHLAKAAEQNGCNVIHTTSPYKAGKVALLNLKEGGIVLAKGSQNGVFAEEAVKQLLRNPADEDYLVRQSADWLAKKAAQFSDVQ